ncbi:hypothetical protein EDD22DRAFT_875150 [Suillus occidentalis]|nr:hypothetical protein EDD22DRAFT_875150 [Suillus occidentalis]
MHVSFAIVLAVAAALVSLTSAVLVDPAAQKCPLFCKKDSQCTELLLIYMLRELYFCFYISIAQVWH